MTLRILACGGREYSDRAQVFEVLDRVHGGPLGPIALLIHGAARGADRLAGEWASALGVPVQAYPADWNRDGRAAGPIRNQRMLVEGAPDMVVVFPGGRGTLDMMQRAIRAEVPVLPGGRGMLPPPKPGDVPHG